MSPWFNLFLSHGNSPVGKYLYYGRGYRESREIRDIRRQTGFNRKLKQEHIFLNRDLPTIRKVKKSILYES